ncbi:MAG: Zn-dependent hydrolase, partial [Bacteroidota bacterium]|nr:Zn-dependent hydrolase [Bacteroidota bacterium]
YMAGILRSVRFGASSAHGKANMVNFNFFAEKGAFERTTKGHYKVNFDKFRIAMNELSALILKLQGDGDKAGVESLMKEKGVIQPQLKADLNRLQEKGIPVDIKFEQGIKILNL